MVAIHGIPCCGACRKAYGSGGEAVEMTNYKTKREYSVVLDGVEYIPVLYMASSFDEAYEMFMAEHKGVECIIYPIVVVYYYLDDGINRIMKKKVFEAWRK